MNYGRREKKEASQRLQTCSSREERRPSSFRGIYGERDQKTKTKKIYSFKKEPSRLFLSLFAFFFLLFFWLSWERKRISWTPSLTHRKRGRRSRGSETPAPTAKKKKKKGRRRGGGKEENAEHKINPYRKKTFEKKNSKQQIKYELLQETKLSDSQLQKLNACYKITAVLLLTNLRLKG